MAAEEDGEAKDRNEKQRRRGGGRRPILATLADDERDEGRHRLRVTAGEQNREGIFVPGEVQAKDRGCRDTGLRLRKHHLDNGLSARDVVAHMGIFILTWIF